MEAYMTSVRESQGNKWPESPESRGSVGNKYKSEQEPFTIKGQAVEPKDHVKILGVVMDTRLK
jgi:hypothetical protein